MKKNSTNLNPIKTIEKNFTREMINDTLKYQKIYGFKIGENNKAHNNQSDAFRHVYMQAYLSLKFSHDIAKVLGNEHEKEGNIKGQDIKESNMDLWNNKQGRQIANEIRKKFKNYKSMPTEKLKDIIACKVVQSMNSGKLITSLDDSRIYKEKNFNINHTPTRSIGGVNKNGIPLGFAANINDRIFTREEIANMSMDEYKKNEDFILQQMSLGNIMTKAQANEEVKLGNLIWVEAYVRRDGTHVSGYYRKK